LEVEAANDVIADLHSHYATNLVPESDANALEAITSAGRRARRGDRFRAFLVRLASRFANYRSFDAGPRVTMETLRRRCRGRPVCSLTPL